MVLAFQCITTDVCLCCSPLVSSAAPTKEPLLSHPKYKLIHALNEGTSGFVQLAEDLRTGEQFAIKFMDRGRASIRNFEREVLNLRLCSLHPHIVKLHEVRDCFGGILYQCFNLFQGSCSAPQL